MKRCASARVVAVLGVARSPDDKIKAKLAGFEADSEAVVETWAWGEDAIAVSIECMAAMAVMRKHSNKVWSCECRRCNLERVSLGDVQVQTHCIAILSSYHGWYTNNTSVFSHCSRSHVASSIEIIITLASFQSLFRLQDRTHGFMMFCALHHGHCVC